MNPLIQLKTTPPLLITLALLCFGLLPKAQAVVPPPDGGYPNFNTAEGQNALFSLTTGSANTAVGWFSLFSDTTGSFNTATGAGALLFNTADENTAFGAAALLFNTTGSSKHRRWTRPAPFSNNTQPASFNNAASARQCTATERTPRAAVTRPWVTLRSLATRPVTSTVPLVIFALRYATPTGDWQHGDRCSVRSITTAPAACNDGQWLSTHWRNNTTGSFNTAIGPGSAL